MSLDNDDQSVEEVLEELAFWKKNLLLLILKKEMILRVFQNDIKCNAIT